MSFPLVIQGDYTTGVAKLNTSDKRHKFGTVLVFPDGRRFAYGKNGAAALVVGDTIQGPARIAADDTDLVCAATAIGATSVSITSASTTAAGTYDAGWLHINKGPGLGHVYRLKQSGANAVLTNGAGDIIYLDPNDPIRAVALTTGSECGLTANEYNGFLQSIATTKTARVVGVASHPLTISYYGFVQTWGVAAVNTAGSDLIGDRMIALKATAGQAGPEAETSGVGAYIGDVLTIGTAAGEMSLVFLKIS